MRSPQIAPNPPSPRNPRGIRGIGGIWAILVIFLRFITQIAQIPRAINDKESYTVRLYKTGICMYIPSVYAGESLFKCVDIICIRICTLGCRYNLHELTDESHDAILNFALIEKSLCVRKFEKLHRRWNNLMESEWMQTRKQVR